VHALRLLVHRFVRESRVPLGCHHRGVPEQLLKRADILGKSGYGTYLRTIVSQEG